MSKKILITPEFELMNLQCAQPNNWYLGTALYRISGDLGVFRCNRDSYDMFYPVRRFLVLTRAVTRAMQCASQCFDTADPSWIPPLFLPSAGLHS